MSNITISQLQVSSMPADVNRSLTMDRRFGLIKHGEDYLAVETHTFLEQTIVPVPDSDPLVDITFHTFCLYEGELYKCRGRKSLSGLTVDATEWKSAIKRVTSQWPDATNTDNVFLSKAWKKVK
jgi:hypothetical protein|tara:strand:- start:358 stop:729 length:372 start_codon:yes stop_codon:yes gene_type:complete